MVKQIELSTDVYTEMTISDSLESGFVHIVTSDELPIQCCLEARKDGKGYKKVINSRDCGEHEGISGDANNDAFKKYGHENCMKKLFSEMRKKGFKII